MKRYESRHCTFGVPDEWEPQAPYGFTEPDKEGEGMSAQAIERWLDQPTPATELAAAEKEVLPHLLDGYELLAEGPHPVASGPGDACFIAYRSLDEDHEPLTTRKIYLTFGTFAVELTLSRPAEDAPRSDGLLEQIGKTLALRNAEFMSRLEPFHLFPEGVEPLELGDQRQPFPRCCVSLPVVIGWDLADENGDAVYRRSGAEIRLHRPVGVEPDAAQWLGEKMAWVQNTQSTLFGSERGELDGGSPFAVVVFEQQGDTRRWNTAAVERSVEVIVEGEQMLLWSLRCRAAILRDCQPVLSALVAAAKFLDPEEWEIQLAEPWLPLRLQGGWRSEGPGVYFNMGDELILQTNKETSRAPLVDLRSSIVESHRGSIDTEKEFTEEELAEKWRGADALKYKIDGRAPTGEPLSLRSFWCTQKEQLYCAVLLARSAESADRGFASIPSALELPH